MSKGLYLLIGLCIGGAAGSGATLYFIKGKYKKQAEEEIAEIRDYYSKKSNDVEVVESDEKLTINRDIYKSTIKNLNYASMDTAPIEEPTEPYAISQEDYDLNTTNDKIALTYWGDDGILTNEEEEMLDIDRMIGGGNLSHFGEYEDDVLYIRNNRLGVDFEVILEHRSYKDVCGMNEDY